MPPLASATCSQAPMCSKCNAPHQGVDEDTHCIPPGNTLSRVPKEGQENLGLPDRFPGLGDTAFSNEGTGRPHPRATDADSQPRRFHNHSKQELWEQRWGPSFGISAGYRTITSVWVSPAGGLPACSLRTYTPGAKDDTIDGPILTLPWPACGSSVLRSVAARRPAAS